MVICYAKLFKELGIFTTTRKIIDDKMEQAVSSVEVKESADESEIEDEASENGLCGLLDKRTIHASQVGYEVKNREDRKYLRNEYKKNDNARLDAESVGPKNIQGSKSAPQAHESKIEKRVHGAIAPIYHVYEETGDVEFLLEQKRDDYDVMSERRKLSLFGGVIDPPDEGSYHTLNRELGEEFSEKEVQYILKRILRENPKPIDDVVSFFDGQISHNYVYVLNVKSEQEWTKTLRHATTTHDAGPSRVLTLEEVVKMAGQNNFAFSHGEIILKFIKKEFGEKYSRALQNDSYFTPQPVHCQPIKYSFGTIETALRPSINTNYDISRPLGNNAGLFLSHN